MLKRKNERKSNGLTTMTTKKRYTEKDKVKLQPEESKEREGRE